MQGEPPQFVGYEPNPGTVRVTLLDGPLRGVEVSVPPSLPLRIGINGRRNGNHTVWITHFYIRTPSGYSHASTTVDDIGSGAIAPSQIRSGPERSGG
jgi:hypothetical protein